MTAITIEQSDAAILSTFNSMEEGQEYVLDVFWFAENNLRREKFGWSQIKSRDDYKLVRRGQKMFVNGTEVFDFTGKNNLALTLTFALALAFSITFAAFAFALQSNGIEKLNNATSCEGKVVEIDGRKYKLTAIQ